MKSRRKANSQPQLSKFKQGFYHHTDEVERAEDDAGVGYRMEKYSDDSANYNVECDFVSFHPDALQKKSSFEKREKKRSIL